MEREIKFRTPHIDVKTKEFKYFTYWGCIDVKGNAITTHDCFSSPTSGSDTFKGWHQQYTGIKDIYGNDIYEGDVVTYQQSERFGESVSDYRTVVKYEEYGFTPMKYHNECEDDFYSCLITNIEVIGNIFESPELIK